MELWLTERETDHVLTKCRIDRTLYQGRSQYQQVAVVESKEYGRMLVLDGIVQTSIRDEFIYHEMIAHVPLTIHPGPEEVLVIGAGDGGTIREVLKHPEIKRVCHVEIDETVIEVSRQYFPELAGMLDDPRVERHITDGIQFVKEKTAAFDAILIDSSDPLGPAEGLFTEAFYADAAKALKPDGIMVAQAGPPFYLPKLIQSIYRAVEKSFATVRLYFASIPTYSAAPYAFVLASKRPLDDIAPRRELANLRYWTPEIHRAAFLIPPFLKEMLEIDG